MTATRTLAAGSIVVIAVLGTAACSGSGADDSGGAPAAPKPVSVAPASSAPASSAPAPDPAATDASDSTGRADGSTSDDQAGEGADAPQIGAPQPGKPRPAGTHTRPATPGGPWYAAYVGTWSGHGRQIVIGRNGSGTMDGRTYVTCGTDDVAQNPGVPCEELGVPADVSVQSVRMVKGPYLEVTKTNDANRMTGKYRAKLSHHSKVLTVTFITGRDGRIDVTFCAPTLDAATSRDLCG